MLSQYLTRNTTFGTRDGRNEDDYLLVETCSLHITLCNKNSCADLQISITIINISFHGMVGRVGKKTDG